MCRSAKFACCCLLASVLAVPVAAQPAASPAAVEGTVTIPIVTGHPGAQPFAPHPGWMDVYAPGQDAGASARVGEDAKFRVASAPGAAIVSFDRMELPPIIVPGWAAEAGRADVAIDPEYVCMPPGYPDAWNAQYKVSSNNFWQTFVPRSRFLYGLMMFDGRKVIWWGNKVNVTVHRDGMGGPRMDFRAAGTDEVGEGYLSAHHTSRGFPNVGWRHGDLPLTPGKKYAVRVGGYNSHGGQHFNLDTYIRPDAGDGYGPGQAYKERGTTGGDLCMILIGSRNGQYVENQIRSPEWDVIVVKRPPVKSWGQSFLAHGVSLAGLRFWGNNGSDKPVSCAVRIREDGPGGKQVGPVKTAAAHDSYSGHILNDLDSWPDKEPPPRPGLPLIRYLDQPGLLPGHDAYYKPPHDLFQVAYAPDEVALTPGKNYYVELEAGEPLMMFADGDYYADGWAWYDGQKVEKDAILQHGDKRWTLLMDIVTYGYPGGAPEPEPPPPSAARSVPSADGNLLVNPGAETGDFEGWTVGADPVIDPSTHIPDPPNHGGLHRFGLSLGWMAGDMYQYQEVSGLEPGATYEAGLWASHGDGTDEAGELLWIDGPFGGKETSLAKTEPEAQPKWKEYKGTLAPTQKTVTIVVRYRHTKPTGVASVHVDDMWLKKR